MELTTPPEPAEPEELEERESEGGFDPPEAAAAVPTEVAPDGQGEATGQGEPEGEEARQRYRTVVRKRGARRRRRRRWLRLALLLAGLAVVAGVAVVADGYWQAYHLAKQVEAALPKLEAARAELGKGAIRSESPFTAAHQAVDQIQATLHGERFTFGWTGILPLLGRPVDAARLGALAAGEGDAALGLGRDLYGEVLGSGSGPSPLLHDGIVDLKVIEDLTPKIEALVAHLEAGDRDLRAIPHVPFVHRLDTLKATALAQSADALRLGRRIEAGVKLLPGFFGADGPKNYFLALQNNADQRATGGASLGYGIVRIDHGRMQLVQGGGIHDLSQGKAFHVSAPKPVRWYLRHANVPPRIDNGVNYTPDFPIVAETWAKQVSKAADLHIDGVIALDPVAVAGLLRDQPPIQIASFPDPITSHNLVDVTEHDQYSLPHADQVEFTAQLVQAAFHVLTSPQNVPLMTKELTTALAEKRIQLWSTDPQLQGLLAELGWDGALKQPNGDYLFLVDEKRLSNKVDFYTHQSIRYTLKLDPAGAGEASVRVRLTNDTPSGQPPYIAGKVKPYGLNVAMLNLYVPGGAENASVVPDVPVTFKTRPKDFLTHTESQDWLVLTKTVEAWPGNPAEITFQYSLPHIVQATREGEVYRLTIQHQPLANPADITVNVLLPPGVKVTANDPGWKIANGLATFHAVLTQDITTTLTYR
jgi:cell division protein FtsB